MGNEVIVAVVLIVLQVYSLFFNPETSISMSTNYLNPKLKSPITEEDSPLLHALYQKFSSSQSSSDEQQLRLPLFPEAQRYLQSHNRFESFIDKNRELNLLVFEKRSNLTHTFSTGSVTLWRKKMPDFNGAEDLREPTIEHSSDDRHVFSLIKEFSLEGPLEDYALSSDQTLAACHVAVYDPDIDSFVPFIRVLNLTDFSEQSITLTSDAEFVAVQNSGRVLTTSPKSVKKIFRVWEGEEDGEATETSYLRFPDSIAQGSPKVKGLSMKDDLTGHLLVHFYNSTNQSQGILAYSAHFILETSQWLEAQIFFMDTSTYSEDDNIFYQPLTHKSSPLAHFARPALIDRIDLESFVQDFELLFSSENLFLFCESIDNIGLFATAGKLTVIECRDGPLFTISTIYLSSPEPTLIKEKIFSEEILNLQITQDSLYYHCIVLTAKGETDVTSFLKRGGQELEVAAQMAAQDQADESLILIGSLLIVASLFISFASRFFHR